jgi:hypothetical protein
MGARKGWLAGASRTNSLAMAFAVVIKMAWIFALWTVFNAGSPGKAIRLMVSWMLLDSVLRGNAITSMQLKRILVIARRIERDVDSGLDT